MHTATTITLNLARLAGGTAVVLGLLFWLGIARSLIPAHMLVGLLVVLALWTLAGLAAFAGGSLGAVLLAVVWGGVVVGLGLNQAQILTGDWHWVVQVVHLLVGVSAVGQAEGLARAIRRARAPAIGT